MGYQIWRRVKLGNNFKRVLSKFLTYLNIDKAQVKLSLNFKSIPCDYLLNIMYDKLRLQS